MIRRNRSLVASTPLTPMTPMVRQTRASVPPIDPSCDEPIHGRQIRDTSLWLRMSCLGADETATGRRSNELSECCDPATAL